MPPKNKITPTDVFTFEQARLAMAEQIAAYKTSKTIIRFEIKIQMIDQLGWLSAQKSSMKVFGANQEDTMAIAGVGEAISLKGEGKVNYAKIFEQLRGSLNKHFPYLQWYGGFCFDHQKVDKDWNGFGSWRFVIPRFELGRDQDKMIFCCNLLGAIDQKAILKELNALKLPLEKERLNLKVLSRKDYPETSVWKNNVETILGQIKQKQCQKVVLARKTVLTLKERVNPWVMLKTLKSVTPNSYHFAFEFDHNVFLGASPERLYKRFGRTILSEALAGTKAKAADPQVLLDSLKDRHEHQLVVDAIIKALQPKCHELYSTAQSVLSLSNGHHLSTKFEGRLKDDIQDEDILESLHPTPAVGGSPKDIAIESIGKIEPFGRGWYAGPLGYVGLDWAEFVVGIRSGLISNKKLSVYAGAGIVHGSNPDDEWKEIENKISNFIKIIK